MTNATRQKEMEILCSDVPIINGKSGFALDHPNYEQHRTRTRAIQTTHHIRDRHPVQMEELRAKQFDIIANCAHDMKTVHVKLTVMKGPHNIPTK